MESTSLVAIEEALSIVRRIAAHFADPEEMYRAAAQLAGNLRSSFSREKVGDELACFVLAVADGDCAFVREWTHEDVYTLVGKEVTAPEIAMPGRPPTAKHVKDGPCDPNRVDGGDRDSSYDELARKRRWYDDEELRFMEAIGSEGWIPIYYDQKPVALLVVMKRTRGHFNQDRLQILRQYQSFVQAFYHLAAFADDRIEKVILLRRVAAVLSDVAEADTLDGFRRAVCTLLTCEFGFRFDRALMFWLPNRGYPAVCEVAVGGNSVSWAEQRKGIGGLFRNLREYILDSTEFPVPGSSTKISSPSDPLYDELNEHKLFFRETDTGMIRDLIEGRLPEDGEAVKLNSNDPWLARVKKDRPGVFISQNDEYWLFPLVPLEGDRTLYGFVVADLAYQPRKHIPWPGNPDLGSVGLVVRLLAGLWQARERAASYLNLLAALPDLRHSAPCLDLPVGQLEQEVVRKEPALWNREVIREASQALIPIARKLANAGRLLESVRENKLSATVPDLTEFLRGFLGEIRQRYAETLDFSLEVAYNGGVRLIGHFLRSIVACCLDNAADSAGMRDTPVTVTVRTSLIRVPEGRDRAADRVLLEICNNGPPIDPRLAPYLFLNRVSTHPLGDRHRGSGLSSARLLAQSHGGDVLLLKPDPVTFGIALLPLAP